MKAVAKLLTILLTIFAILLSLYALPLPANLQPISAVFAVEHPIGRTSDAPRVIDVEAYQFGWRPEIIRVRVGEEFILRIRSSDVLHAIWIDGQDMAGWKVAPPDAKRSIDLPVYGPTLMILLEPGETVQIGPIRFDTPGKFKIRCAIACGPLHPFMMADLIVELNYPFYLLGIFAVIVGVATISYLRRKEPGTEMLGVPLRKEVDLLKIRWIGRVLKKAVQWRGIHFTLILPNLLIFMVVLSTAFFGNPLGALNFSIVIVWILWFTAVEFMILFLGRFWCTLCPIPAFGEWIYRRRLAGVAWIRNFISLRKKWPKKLTNMWVPALGFLGISLIVPWLVTRPVVTGLLFLALIVGALILYIVFEKRIFCLHICPASGYIGHHASVSLFAVRSRDKSICDRCAVKSCVRGCPLGYGCPWNRYPGGQDINTYCGQDFECLKSCPLDNMTLKLRMIGKDLSEKIRPNADEAWMGFIRFILAPLYFLVFFGPYFWIKDWGNMGREFGANLGSIGLLTPTIEGFANWLKWSGIVSSIALAIFPAVFLSFSWLAKRAAGDDTQTLKRVFLALSHSLTPYALFMWLAFGITLITWDWLYPIMSFSNPLGRGWDILGMAGIAWSPPLIPHITPFIISPVLYLGLALGINSAYNIAGLLFKERGRAFRATLVMSVLYIMMAIIYVWIIAG